MDRLTKSAHFISFRVRQTTEALAEKCMQEIVRLDWVPVSIISDRDTRFVPHSWDSLQRSLGSKLKFSTTFHPQTNGQSKITIHILEDMLRACILDLKGSWDDHLYLVEFSYNNSYQASIQMDSYEALYGRKCISPVYWDNICKRKLLGPDLIL